jgi:predicted RNase H-like HicB family nuclease
MPEITITEDEGWFVISDEESGVTTQGETKLEALLMLADALAGYEDTDEDLLATALNVFVPDPDAEELYAEFEDEVCEPPEVSDEQVIRQREATLWLGKSHKRTDYSDPHRFGMLRAFIFGNSYGMTIEQLADLVTNGYWDVFEAIATGTRGRDELAGQLDVEREFVDDAIAELKWGLIGEASDGSLYAAQRVLGINPYLIDDENIIDWEKHYEHTLARDIDEEELPTAVEEGVFVERQGTGYGWHHDPDSYQPHWTDEVVMFREEAEHNGAHPCPRCFPSSGYGRRFDITEMPGGVTKYAPKDREVHET